MLKGPRPLDCINELRERDISCLVGNTDAWILHPPPISETMDDETRDWLVHVEEDCKWTNANIDNRAYAWLEELKSHFERRISPTPDRDQDLLVVHANPMDLLQAIFPNEERQVEIYGYVRQSDDKLDPLLGRVSASAIAFGHLHLPGIRRWEDVTLANISSVSLPGDGDPRAKYAIFEWQNDRGWEVEMFRVSYPIEGEMRAYEQYKPPGWENSLHALLNDGLIAQVV
ncbi:MAG TPA: hypothetical protein VFI27_20145 [candidate division Zixibacteria bacterium]|nr:hypothetical protein [candidate division Zixibacteria bacterium]